MNKNEAEVEAAFADLIRCVEEKIADLRQRKADPSTTVSEADSLSAQEEAVGFVLKLLREQARFWGELFPGPLDQQQAVKNEPSSVSSSTSKQPTPTTGGVKPAVSISIGVPPRYSLGHQTGAMLGSGGGWGSFEERTKHALREISKAEMSEQPHRWKRSLSDWLDLDTERGD